MSREYVVVPYDWYKSVELKRIKGESDMNKRLVAHDNARVVETADRMEEIVRKEVLKSLKGLLPPREKSARGQASVTNTSQLTDRSINTSDLSFSLVPPRGTPAPEVTSATDTSDLSFRSAVPGSSGESTVYTSTPNTRSVNRSVSDDRFAYLLEVAFDRKGDILTFEKKEPVSTNLEKLKRFMFDEKSRTKLSAPVRIAAQWYASPAFADKRDKEALTARFREQIAFYQATPVKTRNNPTRTNGTPKKQVHYARRTKTPEGGRSGGSGSGQRGATSQWISTIAKS